jgi:exopolysaccharide biosynthesis polyprenyl glycosylphosphotransferase
LTSKPVVDIGLELPGGAAPAPPVVRGRRGAAFRQRDPVRRRMLALADALALLVGSIFFWALTATVGTALLLHTMPAGAPSVGQAARFLAATAVGALLLRALARVAWRRLTPPERVLILGAGTVADATHRKLALFPDLHLRAIDAPHPTADEVLSDPPLILGLDVERVIVALDVTDEKFIARLVAICRRAGIKLSLVPPVQGILGTATGLTRVGELAIVEYNTWDVSRSTLLLKRALDVAVSFTALVVLSPVFFVIALLVYFDSPGGIFFSQVRAGEGGRAFRMYKFRTMVRDAEAQLAQLLNFDSLAEPVFKLENDPRVTRIGKVLRRTSLDELPQLFNVLKGDMSLVGPRPEQVELVERYTPNQLVRLSVKPGLSGPMQVHGRAHLTLEERLAVEREYVENLSIARDLRILTLTMAAVVTGRGAS